MNKMSPQAELTLWVGATRYYMGRMTYAVSDFCNLLIGSWNELGENTKAIIQRDVEEEVVRDDESRKRGDSFHPLGHDCDRKSWEHVIKLWTKVTNEGEQT
jgi:hypothetical protein